jgi:hypothetical protein
MDKSDKRALVFWSIALVVVLGYGLLSGLMTGDVFITVLVAGGILIVINRLFD